MLLIPVLTSLAYVIFLGIQYLPFNCFCMRCTRSGGMNWALVDVPGSTVSMDAAAAVLERLGKRALD